MIVCLYSQRYSHFVNCTNIMNIYVLHDFIPSLAIKSIRIYPSVFKYNTATVNPRYIEARYNGRNIQIPWTSI